MFSSNSFNVCPHCGKANSLSARFCSGCGHQLAVPEEVVVCPKCHKTNSPMASFCGGCGAPLRVGAQTKICPKCHREVDANTNDCVCGYRFSSVSFVNPDKGERDREEPRNKNKKKKSSSRPVEHEHERERDYPAERTSERAKAPAKRKQGGGRLVALVGLIFLLVFAYLLVVPAGKLRPDAISGFDGGFFVKADVSTQAEEAPEASETPADDQATGPYIYGWDLITIVMGAFGTDGGGFGALSEQFGTGGIIAIVMMALVMVFGALQAVLFVLRLVTGGRNKKSSLLLLIMALLTTLWIGLVLLSQMEALAGVLGPIFLPAGYGMGKVAYLIPIYFWFFLLFGAFTKKKKIKEAVA